ncbi:TonB-dependent receptor [Acidicapsa ligni]|uniref:TonB-dependent receptor n=1 Tax=Acidicapsa ligni TaxID=542300 RepID=UPI0021DFEABF|nr:TonB-dependent receptor [Acidicapsa ligni]
MKRSHWGAMLLCILISSSFAFGQSATTSLRGVIKDPSGAVIPGATVAITDKSVDKTLSTMTTSTGSYQFSQIPPATYLITVTAQGLSPQSKTAELLVNQPATIDFKLSIQASSETVDVSASAQTLNTSDATLGNSVGNETIQALPMEGRDPVSLLTLQPGVLYLGNPSENDTNDTRSGSVNGGRSDQGNITLDGMDDNDQIAGTSFTGVLRSTLDSTEEFRVTTANGNADSGRSSGAQVSLITKSGTNKYHGALYEYYRPTNTVANEWFNKNQQLSLGEPNTPEKYVMNTFGGAVGGPIKKDKLFFFFNYEGKRQAVDTIVDATVPTAQFYQGQLGYQNTAGATTYLSPSDVAILDSGCMTNIACGVNPNVQAYYAPLAAAGILGSTTGSTTGDGVNNGSYFFASPAPLTQNTSIAKLDYSLSATQRVFFRANLQKDVSSSVENLPGQPAQSLTEDNTKGLAFGHTWTPTANLVNDARYAYIRQGYSTRGIGSGTGDWVNFRFLTQPESQTRSTIVNVPVNNITDNLTWSKGNHTINFGGNWRGIENNRASDLNSYSDGSTNAYWMGDSPSAPADLAQSFGNSYEIAYATLVGTVPETDQQFNYAVAKGGATGSLFPDGAIINRHFKANEFEYYVQDSWRVKPNLTLTFGFRHSILQAPYETKGQQVAPTIDTQEWFLERGYAASKGNVFEPALSFAPSGKANGRPGYWAKQKLNIAPRLAAVYSPNPKTTIRVGGGMFYDHFGEGIANSFDQEGSFGLTTTISTPASTYGFENAPRFTGPHNIPSAAGNPCANPSTITYPYTPQNNINCGFAIAWGVDNHLKTPYSYAIDASFQRELPGGFTFEENYVGRLGRHLLQQLDLAEPVNLVDKQGGGDYFTAAAKLSRIADMHNGNANSTVQPIQYFEDMFPYMANVDYVGESATQAVYSDEWAPTRYGAGETQALEDLDFFDGAPTSGRYWNQQFSSLYAWSSIGTSSYNALQLSLRHPTSHGLTVDVNYTFSKSLDMGSAAERANQETTDAYSSSSGIQNSWNPKLNKAVSDFDTHHLVTFDWVYQLPVGRGKMLLGASSRLTDAFLGGWQFSGLSRWASGLPFSLSSPGWQTNWNQEASGVVTAPVKVHKNLASGIPQVFAGNGAEAINNGITSGNPVRLPYPGEAGERNFFRGDGYFDVDSALSKVWNLPERATLKFAAEVYNVGNNVRFDASPLNLNGVLTSGTLGAYSGVLTTYRRMQFGLRLDF